MSLLYIKESYVYEFREMECHTDGCGYWRTADDHSYGLHAPLRMYKVNGAYCCHACLTETIAAIYEAIEEGEEE